MQVAALGYVGVEAREPGHWREFGPEVLGLQVGPSAADGTIYLRMDERAYRIAVHPGAQDGLAYVGWELPSAVALEAAFEELERAGCNPHRGTADECRARQVRALVGCSDPAGNALELFIGPRTIAQPFQPARPISGFVTGELGLGHVVIEVPDLAAAADFYTRVLGFRVSDYFSNLLLFLHCNPRHHSLALGQLGGTPGLRHIMLEVGGMDDVGTTYDLCQARGVPLAMTLGRHSNDLMYSFYLQTPSGFEIEYGCHGRLVDDATWRVVEIDRPSIWGHQPVGERRSARQLADMAAARA